MAQKYVNLSDTEAGKYISHSLEKVMLMPRRSHNAPAKCLQVVLQSSGKAMKHQCKS